MPVDHGVALYDSDSKPIASASVMPTDKLIGNFRNASIPEVVLTPGYYQIDGLSFTDNYTWNDGGITTLPGITT